MSDQPPDFPSLLEALPWLILLACAIYGLIRLNLAHWRRWRTLSPEEKQAYRDENHIPGDW